MVILKGLSTNINGNILKQIIRRLNKMLSCNRWKYDFTAISPRVVEAALAETVQLAVPVTTVGFLNLWSTTFH